jgi:hypothetical protein
MSDSDDIAFCRLRGDAVVACTATDRATPFAICANPAAPAQASRLLFGLAMKQTTITLAVLAISITAFAGKLERDYVTKEVTPAIDTAKSTLQSSCGCAVAITLDQDNLKSMDELRGARYVAEHISEGAKKYCTDGASKKAICQMKTLTITKAKPAGFTFNGGAGVASTDGNQTCTWDQITRVLDK